MRLSWFCLIMIILIFSACSGEVKKTTNNQQDVDTISIASGWDNSKEGVVDTVLLNKTDTAFIVKPKSIKDDIGDKRVEYITYVYFSNKQYPPLKHENAIGTDLCLIADLNADGKLELLLQPHWFSSCWSSINLYTIKNSKWKLLKQGSMYFCSDKYPLAKRIVKTDNGYSLLTDSLTDDKFITLKKEIKF